MSNRPDPRPASGVTAFGYPVVFDESVPEIPVPQLAAPRELAEIVAIDCAELRTKLTRMGFAEMADGTWQNVGPIAPESRAELLALAGIETPAPVEELDGQDVAVLAKPPRLTGALAIPSNANPIGNRKERLGMAARSRRGGR